MSILTNDAPDLIFVYDRFFDGHDIYARYRSTHPRTDGGLYSWGSQKRRLDEFDPFLSVGGFYSYSDRKPITLSTNRAGRRIVTGVPHLSPSRAMSMVRPEMDRPDAFLMRSGEMILRRFGSSNLPSPDEVAARFWVGGRSPRLVALEDRPADVFGAPIDLDEMSQVYSRLIARAMPT